MCSGNPERTLGHQGVCMVGKDGVQSCDVGVHLESPQTQKQVMQCCYGSQNDYTQMIILESFAQLHSTQGFLVGVVLCVSGAYIMYLLCTPIFHKNSLGM